MNFAMALMSIAILQFTIIPLIADLNPSHATNPNWPSHARTHLVAQVLTTSGIGGLALFILWSGKVDPALALCITSMLVAAALLPFFISAATGRFFGGELMPARLGIGRFHLGAIEGNLLNFGLAALLFAIGRGVAAWKLQF